MDYTGPGIHPPATSRPSLSTRRPKQQAQAPAQAQPKPQSQSHQQSQHPAPPSSEHTAPALPLTPTTTNYLTRSNSTTAAPATTTASARSRFLGHFRTSSSVGSGTSPIPSTTVLPSWTSSSASNTTVLPLSSRHGSTSSSSNPHSSRESGGGGGHPSASAAAFASYSAAFPSAAALAGAQGAAIPRPDWQAQHVVERMPAAGKYYQDKELPNTPRLETHNTTLKIPRSNNASGSASEPSSARTPLSATASPNPQLSSFYTSIPFTGHIPTGYSPGYTSILGWSPGTTGTTGLDRRAFTSQHAAMPPDANSSHKPSVSGNAAFPRNDSVSGASAATSLSSRTMVSSDPPHSTDWASLHQIRPFVVRNGRTYVSDHTLPYPFPVDLPELHRQTLQTLMLYQLYGAPVCSPTLQKQPPTRVLEVGCGSGFWSMTCHRYYARRGHTDISFTGIDIVPLSASGTSAGSVRSGGHRPSISSAMEHRPDKEMKWRFVQHDIRRTPWPFQDGEFDLVFVKDMSSATSSAMAQQLMDEYIRVLAPGGTLEVWDHDLTLRMLRPHVPDLTTTTAPRDMEPAATADSANQESSESEEDGENMTVADMGAYVMTANTPLSTPTNQFLLEYNGWLSKALENRGLSPVPCAFIGPTFLQEAESLMSLGNRRLAIPLSEVRWEREGVGGVVTKDGKSYITRGKAGQEVKPVGKGLKPAAAALRRTALITVVQMIQCLEPLVREGSGKNQDEWDNWLGKLMNDLLKENGTSWGECLEVGAWWATKRA